MLASPTTVHHFNRNTKGGGESVAALRLAETQKKSGMQVSFWHPEASEHPFGYGGGSLHYAKPHPWLYNWQKKQILGLYRKYPKTPFSLPWHHDKPVFDPAILGNGVLHFHTLGGLLDYEAFFAHIPKEHPIVWTLHDQHLLTGGCYSPNLVNGNFIAQGCQKLNAACGTCPQLKQPGENDLSHKILSLKLRLFQGRNIHLVGPSEWMTEVARTSAIGRAVRSVRMIHNPLDTDLFHPADRTDARRLLNITNPAPIIAFGAHSTTDRRKGIQHLIPALLKIKHEVSFQLVIFGHSMPPELHNSGIPYKHLGFVAYPHFQQLMYSAADILTMTSLEETLGQVGTESLACGTPIVAFRTGGIPDYVKHGETGFLAETGNTEELALRLKEALSDPARLLAMRARAREVAVEKFEANKIASQYAALYEEACQHQKSS